MCAPCSLIRRSAPSGMDDELGDNVKGSGRVAAFAARALMVFVDDPEI